MVTRASCVLLVWECLVSGTRPVGPGKRTYDIHHPLLASVWIVSSRLCGHRYRCLLVSCFRAWLHVLCAARVWCAPWCFGCGSPVGGSRLRVSLVSSLSAVSSELRALSRRVWRPLFCLISLHVGRRFARFACCVARLLLASGLVSPLCCSFASPLPPCGASRIVPNLGRCCSPVCATTLRCFVGPPDWIFADFFLPPCAESGVSELEARPG